MKGKGKQEPCGPGSTILKGLHARVWTLHNKSQPGVVISMLKHSCRLCLEELIRTKLRTNQQLQKHSAKWFSQASNPSSHQGLSWGSRCRHHRDVFASCSPSQQSVFQWKLPVSCSGRTSGFLMVFSILNQKGAGDNYARRQLFSEECKTVYILNPVFQKGYMWVYVRTYKCT